jgi:hypothetical protein
VWKYTLDMKFSSGFGLLGLDQDRSRVFQICLVPGQEKRGCAGLN